MGVTPAPSASGEVSTWATRPMTGTPDFLVVAGIVAITTPCWSRAASLSPMARSSAASASSSTSCFAVVAVVALGGFRGGTGLLAALTGDAVAPTGVRRVYLIRHGAYDEDDPRDPEVGRGLTDVGREQARLTGARLAALGTPIDVLHSSTMTRARETAEIIGAALGGMAPHLARDLMECTPPTDRADIMAEQRPGAPDSCRE